MEEAAAPHGCYRSFDAFFTRSLREGVRPVADTTVVSPCDGVISALGPIDEGARLFVKGQPYEVADLVGAIEPSRQYVGGQFAVIYLSPKDYHRVHSPIDGHLLSIRATPGGYYPVNALGQRLVPQLLVQNRRVAFFMRTNDGLPITLVMVGALIVGKITANALGDLDVAPGVHELGSGILMRKGDELGAFHLGSTVVLLAAPGISFAPSNSRVRYGQSLAVRAT
jgi:phosphatidylserine decarboxylase